MKRCAVLVASVLAFLSTFVIGATPAHADDVTFPAVVPQDCSVDVGWLLQGWLNSLPNGTTAHLQPNACYLVSATITINKAWFSLDGAGATIKRNVTSSLRGDDYLAITQSGVVAISNLNISGPTSPDYPACAVPQQATPDCDGYQVSAEFQHGVHIIQSNGVLLDHVDIEHVFGDGIYIVQSSNVTLQYSHINQTGRQGITFSDAHHVNLGGNTIERDHHHNLDFEPSSSGFTVDDVNIAYNTFKYSTLLPQINGVAYPAGCDADPNTTDCRVNVTNVRFAFNVLIEV